MAKAILKVIDQPVIFPKAILKVIDQPVIFPKAILKVIDQPVILPINQELAIYGALYEFWEQGGKFI